MFSRHVHFPGSDISMVWEMLISDESEKVKQAHKNAQMSDTYKGFIPVLRIRLSVIFALLNQNLT